MGWPTNLRINAWTGEQSLASPIDGSTALSWALKETLPKEWDKTLAPPKRVDRKKWANPRVGWGLILPYRPDLSESALAEADDAPEAIRRLRVARGNAPVFRYRPDSVYNLSHLLTYRSGVAEYLPLHSSPLGIKKGQIPYYLLIYAKPDEVPWRFQYKLNARHAVGRLELPDDGLNNYVDALLNNWDGAAVAVDRPVIWAVVHGPNDMTKLMRDSIAKKIYDTFHKDKQMRGKIKFLDGLTVAATGQSLINTLSKIKPGLVITTSHGQTGPLADLGALESKLGLPVDHYYQPLSVKRLLSKWKPHGAIWYAHACCSAGSDDSTYFNGLFPSGSPMDKFLKGIAKLGSKIAPLPKLLLGAKKPLRAFIGHVEPTFDWTLCQPGTDTYFTDPIRQAMYTGLYQPEPVGLALRPYYDQLSGVYIDYDQAQDIFDGENTKETLLFCRLVARDIQSMVVLGDPTATLPSI